jgi:hypothetical protein
MPITDKKVSDLDYDTRKKIYVYLHNKCFIPDTLRKEKQREELIDSAVLFDVINELLFPLIDPKN